MRYLSGKELKREEREYAQKKLGSCAGKTVKDLFAIKIFNEYCPKFFPDENSVKILDLGTAGGIFISQLYQEKYKNLYGIDIDEYLPTEKKALLKEFKTADLSWDPLPWPDNFFQVVTGWCILPHLENPHNCIREVYRVLDKNGLFIITLPHIASKASTDYFLKTGDLRSYGVENNHIAVFSKGVFQKTILKYFDTIALEYYVNPKIFRGLAGEIRKALFRMASFNRPLKRIVTNRWGYNQIWVLRKKP